MLVLRAGIINAVRIVNRGVPDPMASLETVRSVSALFVLAFWAGY